MTKIKKEQTINYSDSDIKKFLTGKVKSSGFSLENDVARFLKKNYRVQREVPFYDKDEEKGRTFDILARKFFPDDSNFDKDEKHSIAQYNLIIECKNIPGHVWIFDHDDDIGFLIPEHSSVNKGKNLILCSILLHMVKFQTFLLFRVILNIGLMRKKVTSKTQIYSAP